MRITFISSIVAFALCGHVYAETFDALTVNGGITVNTGAVPLTMTETGQSGAGAKWRMPLDGRVLRFDASVDGVDFSPYKTVFSMKPSGEVGIGTRSQSELLYVTRGGSDGDAVMVLESDYHNNDELDNARIELLQDGRVIGAQFGFFEEALSGSPGQISNLLRIGTKYHSNYNWSAITINPVNGNVGIGTGKQQNKLDVAGTIRAEEIIVATGWADYELRSLSEVESHIAEHGNLPGVPSAAEVADSGVSLGDSQRMLLEKVEELTLYMIELKRENESLRDELNEVESTLIGNIRLVELEERNQLLEDRLVAIEELFSK